MRLIDADELMKKLQERDLALCVTEWDIREAPTVDAVPVVHGHWNDAYPDIEPNPMFMYGICSECGFEQGISNKLNYCPHCGAKMDRDEERRNK